MKYSNLVIENLPKAISPDMQALELRQTFLRMQWDKEEE